MRKTMRTTATKSPTERTMMITRLTQGGLFVVLVLGASGVQAQELETPVARQGYWVGAGLHLGTMTSWEDGDTYGPWPANVISLRAGQLLTRRFGIGLHLEVGGAEKEKESSSLIGFGFDVTQGLWRNLALRGGVGLGVVQLADKRVEDEDLRGGYGGQYTLGLTYDFFPWRRRLTGGWAITPSVMVRGLPGQGAAALTGTIGVEITWWSGRPRDQLELPDAEAYKKH